jgi:flagellar basal-body rod modification protein FlgD
MMMQALQSQALQSQTAANQIGQSSQNDRAKASVDYDAFLQLLVAQMRNQDPTAPTDSTEFLAQLAAFSNVEQGIKTNERLDALLAQGSVAQAGSLVGLTYSKGDITGVVDAVIFEDGGMRLRLDNGDIVALEPGAIIGRAPTL